MTNITNWRQFQCSSQFISYSHDDRDHEAALLRFANRLRGDGVDANIDQYEPVPVDGWPLWMDKQIRDADFVLLVCTQTYYRRVMKEVVPGEGLGVCWEANLIYQHLYDSQVKNDRFLPVVLSPDHSQFIPTPLRGSTRYSVETSEGYETLYRRLTGQCDIEKPALGKLKALPHKNRYSDGLENLSVPDIHADRHGRLKSLKR